MSIAWCLKGGKKYIKISTSRMNYVKLPIINIKLLIATVINDRPFI